MAFVSLAERRREAKTSTVTCRKCGEDGLLWDRTVSGRNWLYDISLASQAEVAAFEKDPNSLANARMTEDYGLVMVLKYRAHLCPEAKGDRLEDHDRPNDLEENDSDEIMGLRVQDEAEEADLRGGIILDEDELENEEAE